MPQYKLLEGEGLESKVQKSEFTVDFSLQDVKTSYEKIQQMIKELESKKKIEDASMKNVEGNHDIIGKLNDQEIVAVYLWQEAKNRSIICQEEIDKLNKHLENYDKELEEVKNQLGIDIWK
jgi:predicted RNase H-like nuclease (RuvC/YqgF family)